MSDVTQALPPRTRAAHKEQIPTKVVVARFVLAAVVVGIILVFAVVGVGLGVVLAALTLIPAVLLFLYSFGGWRELQYD